MVRQVLLFKQKRDCICKYRMWRGNLVLTTLLSEIELLAKVEPQPQTRAVSAAESQPRLKSRRDLE